MSRLIHTTNPHAVFSTRSEIENYFHSKLNNTKKLIGTELELFVVDAQGKPLYPSVTSELIASLIPHFQEAKSITENNLIVGLNIPHIGTVSLEPGGQVEISTIACTDLSQLKELNEQLLGALQEATQERGMSIKGQGHMEEFLEAPDAARSRFAAYYRYCRDQHGEPANDLIKTMKSVCGLQVNLDPMGKDFHEVYRALMLVEIGHHLKTRSVRQKRLQETYATLFPEQVTPMFNALAARDNQMLISMIVDRFLTLKVPFLPDAEKPEVFVSTLDVFNVPPTIGDLLQRGLLTHQVLDNCLSLQMTMPNLRGKGVLETRAPDSTSSLSELMQTATHYYTIAYDVSKRRLLLSDFSGIDPNKLEQIFNKRFLLSAREISCADIGGGKVANDLIRATQPVVAKRVFPRQKLLP